MKEFEKYYFRVIDENLYKTLEPWQEVRVKNLCKKIWDRKQSPINKLKA